MRNSKQSKNVSTLVYPYVLLASLITQSASFDFGEILSFAFEISINTPIIIDLNIDSNFQKFSLLKDYCWLKPYTVSSTHELQIYMKMM